MTRWILVAAASALLLAACGSGGAESTPTAENTVTTIPASSTPTAMPAEPSASPEPATPDPEATVELTGSMVDTEVTVAVYADTETQPASTACVDLVQLIVPARAADEVEWKPISCTFDLRTWNRIQFNDRNGTWFVHAVYVLFPLVGEKPNWAELRRAAIGATVS